MRFLFVSVLLSLSFAAGASTVTLDFEEFTVGDPGPLVSQQFSVAGDAIGVDILEGATNNMVQSLGFWWQGRVIAIVQVDRVDGGAFSLMSADWVLRDEQNAYWLDPYSYVVGNLADGSTIIAHNAAELGQGDWLNIESALFVGDMDEDLGGYPTSNIKVMVDNIVVGAAVPIPAAVWLFGSALAGLGFMRGKA